MHAVQPPLNTPSSPVLGSESQKHSRHESHSSLIYWDTNVVNFVYSCLYPGPRKFANVSSEVPFRRSHRRIVSATTNWCFGFGDHQFCPSLSKMTDESDKMYIPLDQQVSQNGKLSRHMRQISDPTSGRQFFRFGFIPDPRINAVPTTAFMPAKPIYLTEQTSGSLKRGAEFSNTGIVDNNFSSSVDIGDTECLIGCLQSCARPPILITVLFAIVFVQSMVASGYLSSIFTTLERRFDLTSRQVGYIYGSFEVAGVISTVVFSFLNGHKRNRLRVIGFCTLLLGAGFALFALPHWLSGSYIPNAELLADGQQRSALCSRIDNSAALNYTPFSRSRPCSDHEAILKIAGKNISTDYTIALPLFCLALGLAGIGSSSLYVLGPTYLWDNLSESQYPIYSGLFYTAAALGPACGFLAGAGFLLVYIDSPHPPPSPTLTPYDHAWLGAWWLGMLVFAVLAWITALPILTFPRRLPSTGIPGSSQTASTAAVPKAPEEFASPSRGCGETMQEEPIEVKIWDEPANGKEEFFSDLSADAQLHKRSVLKSRRRSKPSPLGSLVTHNEDTENGGPYPVPSLSYIKRLKRRLQGPMRIMRRVLFNPIWLGVTAITVVEQTIVSAFLTYAAKYIQSLFRIPAYIASIHTGAVVIPSAVLGVLTGAFLMRYFRPSIPRTLQASLFTMIVTLITSILLMSALGCSNNLMAGVTATYSGEPWPSKGLFSSMKPANLTATCNADCIANAPPLPTILDHSSIIYSCPHSEDYNPVCWQSSDHKHAPAQITFFNPCLAGCSHRYSKPDNNKYPTEIYAGCRCVTDKTLTPLENSSSSGLEHEGFTTKGACDPKCRHYIFFLIVIFLHIFVTGLNQNPSNVITLSCVSPEDGSVALGLQVFFTRTLAYIPAPIYFGMLMDLVCQYRATPNRRSCNDSSFALKFDSLVKVEGACLEYNVRALPFVWLGGVALLKLISLACVLITWRASLNDPRFNGFRDSASSIEMREDLPNGRTSTIQA